MARTDLSLIFALIAGAGLLGAGLWATGALAKPPWMSVVKDASGKDIIMIGGKCYNETGNSVACPTTSCPTGQTAVGGVCVPITCPAGQSLINGVCVTTPVQCPSGQTLLNGVCVPILCPAGTHLSGNACIADTVTPPPPAATSTIDSFDSSPYVLNAGSISPNGLWRGVFTSGGILQQANGAMNLQPQAVTSPGATSAPFILGTKDYGNFEATFKMSTDQQLRTGSAPNNWETAWFMWHYTDVTHHYYFTIKMNGCEMGKKDNAPGNTNLEDQLFLATPGCGALVLGQYNDIKVRMEGFHIQVWLNNNRIIDFTDTAVHDPSKMSHGMVGMYSEDSKVRFDLMSVVALP